MPLMNERDPAATILHGDCIALLNTLEPDSVDAIVTDPPYGLGFMGKDWDALPPGKEWAEACLRVLKPGGHLLAFGGTRTWHRLAAAIEDAGFEIRDSIAWMYGTGFPKSLDVARAIERYQEGHLSGEALQAELRFTEWMRSTGVTARQLNEATGTQMGSHYLTAATQPAIPTAALMDRMRHLLPEVPAWIEDIITKREAARVEAAERNADKGFLGSLHLDSPRSEAESAIALEWQGWGTALKPGFEPVVVARKPFKGSVAANVLAHGTGALNIDACRIDTDEVRVQGAQKANGATGFGGVREGGKVYELGRWPANVVLDEPSAAELDTQAPNAARFFYVAKAPTKERPNVDGVQHPTVKPLALMRWLVRLVTPPGGIIVDPFAGSGTTVEAALLEGFDVIGMEREADYLPLIAHRIDRACPRVQAEAA